MADWDAVSTPAQDWDAVSKPAQPQRARAKPKRGPVDYVTGLAANFNRGAGIGDEIAAAGGVVAGLATGRHRFGADKPGNWFANNAQMLKDAYDVEMGGVRKSEDDFARTNPNAAALARGTGMAATVAVPAGGSTNLFNQAVRVPTVAFSRGGVALGSKAVPQVVANAARGTGLAATQAGIYAGVDRGTVAERGEAMGDAMTNPLTLALGAGGGALATTRAGKVQPAPAYPTVAQLEQTKRDLYTQANASGFKFSDPDMQTLSAKVTAEFQKRAGSGPEGKLALPVANSLRARLEEMSKSGNVTLEQLDGLRADAYQMAVAPGGPDSVIGSFLRREIDALMDGYNVPLIKEARKANTQWMKASEIANRQRSGELGAASANSGQNVVNAQRAKIRPTIDPLHSSEITNWTPEELAAATTVVMGSPKANRLRDRGNFLRNPIVGAGAAAVGGTMGIGGGPAGSAVLGIGIPALMQLAGQYFRKAAEKVTAKDIDALQRLIAEGRIAAPVVRGASKAGVPGPVAARLSRGVGAVGGSQAGQQPNLFAQP